MLPLDDGPQRSRRLPIVTVCLVSLHIAFFLYELSLGAGVGQLFRVYGLVPHEVLTGLDIPPAGPDPLWLQLVTSLFLHAGWPHLIVNMIYLCIFGDDIEGVLGHGRYLLFYLGAGIAASLIQVYVSGPADTRPVIGASGAIAGVLGAYLIFFPKRRVQVWVPLLVFVTLQVSAVVLLGLWFLLQLLNGLAAVAGGSAQDSGVAVWAHIGGFLVGALVAVSLRGRFVLQRRAWA